MARPLHQSRADGDQLWTARAQPGGWTLEAPGYGSCGWTGETHHRRLSRGNALQNGRARAAGRDGHDSGLLAEDADLLEPDGRPFDKSQPRLLRQLAADRLYARWRKAGLAVSEDDVLVCPV